MLERLTKKRLGWEAWTLIEPLRSVHRLRRRYREASRGLRDGDRGLGGRIRHLISTAQNVRPDPNPENLHKTEKTRLGSRPILVREVNAMFIGVRG